MRIGTGYDVHRLEEGRKLILGGVQIPFEKGLLGHSMQMFCCTQFQMLCWERRLLEILENTFRTRIRHLREQTV